MTSSRLFFLYGQPVLWGTVAVLLAAAAFTSLVIRASRSASLKAPPSVVPSNGAFAALGMLLLAVLVGGYAIGRLSLGASSSVYSFSIEAVSLVVGLLVIVCL